jgi:hypothetical protein
MLTIYEPPRHFAVQRETNSGGRVRVGMYATLEDAKQAVVRSVQRNDASPEQHSIFKATWEAIPIETWGEDVAASLAAGAIEADPIPDEEDQ